MKKLKVTIYGIKNCDKIKKAKTWLELQNVVYTYIDYRKDGISDEFLQQQIETLGIDSLINKRGTTWRKLTEAEKSSLNDINQAIEILKSYPALIKRPLLIANCDSKNSNLLGFTAKQYLSFFNDLLTLNGSTKSALMHKGIA